MDKCPNCGWFPPVENKTVGNVYNTYMNEAKPADTCKMASSEERITSKPTVEGVKPVVWVRKDVFEKEQEAKKYGEDKKQGQGAGAPAQNANTNANTQTNTPAK